MDLPGAGPDAGGPTATFTYTTKGTYTVLLTVTDDRGGTSRGSLIVAQFGWIPGRRHPIVVVHVMRTDTVMTI
ncbi:MAG: PKD domain-containing protein [Bacillota bacterium]